MLVHSLVRFHTPIKIEKLAKLDIFIYFRIYYYLYNIVSELSAKELDDNTEKLGPLDKKSKFFVFERQKRLFAAIKENWLLLYSTRTSPKPLESLNLAYLTAKPTEGAKTKTFVLICITTQETFHVRIQ